MKFICDKNLLIKEISIAQDIITSKNTLSILSNVLFICEENSLTIKATDLKVSFETKIPVDSSEPGLTTVYCEKLLTILRSLPEGEIEFENTDENILFMKPLFRKINFQLKSLSADKYPAVNNIEAKKYYEFSQSDFLEMINQTIFAVSDDETRYFMNGVYFESESGKVKMVATDGRRLSYIEKATDQAIQLSEGIIIPPKILYLIKKLASGEGSFKIYFDEKSIYVVFDNHKLSSTLIEGQFPNYKRVIPDKQNYSFEIQKEDLIEAVKRVSLLVEQKSKRVYMALSNNLVTMSSEESEMGKAIEEIPCQYEGPDEIIALNYLYLQDPLKAIKGNTIRFEFSEPNKAVTMLSEEDKNSFHIIMPMQIE